MNKEEISMASPHVKIATDANFVSDVLGSDTPSLIDFWAEWCGPCRALGPLVDQIAEENQGKLKVYKMNVDENPNTPAQYGVRGIPTLILVKNGKVVDQLVGSVPKNSLDQFVKKNI
jgi:thioredoxin